MSSLPAWSLPSGERGKIEIAQEWPAVVTAEWAYGESKGAGVRVCILDSGVDRDHPLVGAVRAVRGGRRGGGRLRGRRRPGGRSLRARHGVRRDREAAGPRVQPAQRARARRGLHGERRRAPGRAPLGDRTGLRRDQHEHLDHEEQVRSRAPRARGQRLLRPHHPRRLGAQPGGRQLPVALLVGDLRRQPRGGRSAPPLRQSRSARRVLRARRRPRRRLARRRHAALHGQQLRDAARQRRSARSPWRSIRSWRRSRSSTCCTSPPPTSVEPTDDRPFARGGRRDPAGRGAAPGTAPVDRRGRARHLLGPRRVDLPARRGHGRARVRSRRRRALGRGARDCGFRRARGSPAGCS